MNLTSLKVTHVSILNFDLLMRFLRTAQIKNKTFRYQKHNLCFFVVSVDIFKVSKIFDFVSLKLVSCYAFFKGCLPPSPPPSRQCSTKSHLHLTIILKP